MHNHASRPLSRFRLVVVGLAASSAAIVGLASYTSVSSAAQTFAIAAPATQADGVLPDGVTVFDDGYPGVARLEPGLLEALRRAATTASAEGIEFQVNDGWRSRSYQDQLLREAVDEYGSAHEAARWVATADNSEHVSGNAVDIGHVDATLWLSEHGADYGLCQIYENEPWHFELRPDAVESGCPAMYPDPTYDPRMQ